MNKQITMDTPLTTHATRAMLLGSGELGKEATSRCNVWVLKPLPWIATPMRRSNR